MHPESFTKIMVALYGAHWQTSAAALFGITRRTLYRWSAGKGPIPPRVPKLLLDVCSRRAQVLGDIAQVLGQVEAARTEAAKAVNREMPRQRPKLAIVSVSRK